MIFYCCETYQILHMKPIVIIGAGLTGLSCAYHLDKAGLDYKIYEKEPEIGGRLRTEKIDGFTVDRGFQVYLTAYPESQKILGYKTLDLHNFDPGALILQDGGKIDMAYDPLRMPAKIFKSMSADIGTLWDKFKILSLRSSVLKERVVNMFNDNKLSTAEHLKAFGFSQKMIDTFFRPFYGGIFLEDELVTSASMFRFVYRMFSLGHAALPSNGMAAIPAQIASSLDSSKIFTNHTVNKISPNSLQIEGGDEIEFDHCVVATEGNYAKLMTGHSAINDKQVSSTQFYFVAETKPYTEKLIALNPDKNRLVNNICVLNNIVGAYAQKNNLISATVLNDTEDKCSEKEVQKEIQKWFPSAENWRLLKRMHISYSLPDQQNVSYGALPISQGNLLIAGDHIQNGSINNACKMGEDAAKILIKKYS